jgi:hypothetical protein
LAAKEPCSPEHHKESGVRIYTVLAVNEEERNKNHVTAKWSDKYLKPQVNHHH